MVGRIVGVYRHFR